VKVKPKSKKRPLGMDRKRLWVSEDFDAPDPELEALFHRELRDIPKEFMPQPKPDSSRKKVRRKA
jgi:hypothetical protein